MFFEEVPIKPAADPPISEMHENGTSGNGGFQRKSTPGSMAFVPAAAGLLMASEIVKDLIKEVKDGKTG